MGNKENVCVLCNQEIRQGSLSGIATEGIVHKVCWLRANPPAPVSCVEDILRRSDHLSLARDLIEEMLTADQREKLVESYNRAMAGGHELRIRAYMQLDR